MHRAAISCIRETGGTIDWAGLSGNGPEVQISQGKSFNGGSFNGNEEEGKKEKALTASETQSRIVRIFTGLSGEAPPERLFLSAVGFQLPCSSVYENLSCTF